MDNPVHLSFSIEMPGGKRDCDALGQQEAFINTLKTPTWTIKCSQWSTFKTCNGTVIGLLYNSFPAHGK